MRQVISRLTCLVAWERTLHTRKEQSKWNKIKLISTLPPHPFPHSPPPKKKKVGQNKTKQKIIASTFSSAILQKINTSRKYVFPAIYSPAHRICKILSPCVSSIWNQGFQKPKIKYVKIQKQQSTERLRVYQRLTVNYPEVQSYLPDEAALITGAFHGLWPWAQGRKTF